MTRPIVSIVGATGYVGSFLTKSFLEALKDGRIKELRVLTSKKSSKTEEFEKQGAKTFEVNFSKKDTLLVALKSVDIVISAIGKGEGLGGSNAALLDALTQSGVDIYFPSEFGTNHYSPNFKFQSPVYTAKQEHFKAAQQKSGLKVVRIFCYMIMEFVFTKLIGLDCQTGIWKIPGMGDTPVGLTSVRDIGRFTMEAALLAFNDPDAVPDGIDIVGVTRTLKEYAEVLESASDQKIKIQNFSLEEAIQTYEKTKSFFNLIPISMETGASTLTPEEANGNRLLNPGQSKWALKTIEEYAQETGGKP